MKHLIWLARLSRRTLFAFFPSLARPDDDFARHHLPDIEYQLYQRMDPRERDHACRVAKAVLAQAPPSSILIRAALLHDLGKTSSSYHALERILVHLYTPQNLAAEPRLTGLKGAWQRKLHHAHYGAELIRKAGGCPNVAELVERHHQPQGCPEAAILKTIEEGF
jgi:putative nucleotidyltransferase with HDIG domain